MHKKFKMVYRWVKNRRCISGCAPTTTPCNEGQKQALVANRYPYFVSDVGGCARVTNNSSIYSSSQGSVCGSCGALPTEAGLEPRQLNQSRQDLCHGLHKPTASGSTLQEKNDLLIFVSVVIDNSCIQRCTNGSCQGQSQMSPWASMSECLPRPFLLPSMGQVRFSCPCSLLGWQHLLYHCLLLTWIPACSTYQGLPCARLINVFHVYWDLHSCLKNEHPAFR